MHPIEHLRYLARADSSDAAALVSETASALGALGGHRAGDQANLVVASRRIIEKHPTVGPLWWLCSHLLVAADTRERAWELSAEAAHDPTPANLAAELPPGATVLTGGFPWAAIEAFAERDDVTVAVLADTDESWRFLRRLNRFGVATECLDASEAADAAARADLVLIGAKAGCEQAVLVGPDAVHAARAGADALLPVWLATGVGSLLPHRYVEAIAGAAPDAAVALDIGLVARAVGPGGSTGDVRAALRRTAPFAPELLRAVPAR